MNCLKCKSHRVMKFIDGFGNKRCFCRQCGSSFLEHSRVLPTGEKNLLGVDTGLYQRPGVRTLRSFV